MNRDVEPLKPTDPNSFGGWKIKGRLGEGGYSTIFLGEKNEQLAAVKMIRRELLNDLKVFERFATEINNLERINHPGIARIIESDLSTDVPYIAVEYIEGKTLEQEVETSGPLTESEWLDCLTQVAAALDYCHKISITHKDVSPGNIILSQEGPKLIDFGISYHEGDQRVTQVDETVGTPEYMSPEHWDSKPRSQMDIFSLGSTFTFAGTGHSAFIGESKQEIREAIWRINPNLEGLSKTQINLMTPLLYKDFKDRPNLSELIKTANKLRENPELKVFENYLKDSERKLVNQTRHSGSTPTSSSKYILSGSILGLLAAVLFLYIALNTNSSQVSEAERSPLPITFISPPSNLLEETNELITTQSTSNASQPTEVTSKEEKEFSQCQLLTDEGKVTEAIQSCKVAAKAGHALSMSNLGYNYYVNLKNEKLGIYWYKKASEAGASIGSYNLGTLYLEKKDTVEAEKWFKKCADSNYGYCSFNYGVLLERAGRIVEAKKAYQKGVDLKDSGSAQNLGLIYTNEQNWAKAKEVFLVGAELDNYNSAYSLAQVYAKNYSDLTNACIWFYKSLKLNKKYDAARKAVIEICKNRKFDLAPDVKIITGGSVPYQVNDAGSDRKKGDWVIWIKNEGFDASSLTGIQYRARGSSEDWKFTFYGTYTNPVGIYSYISERPGLDGVCLDFRLVKESAEAYISQIWELPNSTCRTS